MWYETKKPLDRIFSLRASIRIVGGYPPLCHEGRPQDRATLLPGPSFMSRKRNFQ